MDDSNTESLEQTEVGLDETLSWQELQEMSSDDESRSTTSANSLRLPDLQTETPLRLVFNYFYLNQLFRFINDYFL